MLSGRNRQGHAPGTFSSGRSCLPVGKSVWFGNAVERRARYQIQCFERAVELFWICLLNQTIKILWCSHSRRRVTLMLPFCEVHPNRSQDSVFCFPISSHSYRHTPPRILLLSQLFPPMVLTNNDPTRLTFGSPFPHTHYGGSIPFLNIFVQYKLSKRA